MTEGENQELMEFLRGQFAGIDRRFDAVDRRFDQVDARFDRVDTRLDAHESRLKGHDASFETLATRLTRVEIIQEQHTDLIRLVADGVVSVSEKLDRGFAAVDRRFDETTAFFRLLFVDQRERIDALDVRVTRLERRKR